MADRFLTTPVSDDDVMQLSIGDQVFISGVIYTARDAAHKRLVDLMDQRQELPVELRGQVIYYVGPSPAKPGRPIGSAGPTTSYRMDAYAPRLIAEKGLKVMIGKGSRSAEVKQAMRDHKAVYLAAVGGAAALIARRITAAQVVAYPELGAEAIQRLEVDHLPAIVVNDCHGGDLYEEGIRLYRR